MSGNNSVSQTPTNEFVSLSVNNETDERGGATNPIVNEPGAALPNEPTNERTTGLDEGTVRPDDDLMSNDETIVNAVPSEDGPASRSSRLDETNLNSSRRTASTSRLHNANLNNLNTNLNNNLSESTESLTNFKNFNISDCHSEEEIRNLSVRQLKLVLTRNYVNYKGCCEKEELQQKAIRLWNQIKQDKGMEFEILGFVIELSWRFQNLKS